jgi:hypothetical protein
MCPSFNCLCQEGTVDRIADHHLACPEREQRVFAPGVARTAGMAKPNCFNFGMSRPMLP